MKTHRVVQLTDTHLVATPGELLYGTDSGASLADAIHSIQNLSPRPQAIIITGDIAQDGLAQSYARVKNLLKPLDLPVYVLPGNHDVRTNMVSDLIDEKIQLGNEAKIGAWQWLFLDSTVAGRDYGELSTEALAFLRQRLNENQHIPTVIALHHSPTYECSAFDCQLQNRNELIDIINQHDQVKGVIAGHVHCATEHALTNCLLMATPSTFLHVEHHSKDPDTDHSDVRLTHTIDEGKRAYRILDLSNNGSLETHVCWF